MKGTHMQLLLILCVISDEDNVGII